MNSRERVATSIRFDIPDRVPIDLGGLKASGIACSAYDRLKKQLGIDTPTSIMDARFMVALVEDAVLQRLHADVKPFDVTVIPAFAQPEDAWVPKTLYDGTDVRFMPGTRIVEDAEKIGFCRTPMGRCHRIKCLIAGIISMICPLIVAAASTRRNLRRPVIFPMNISRCSLTIPGICTSIPIMHYSVGDMASVSSA